MAARHHRGEKRRRHLHDGDARLCREARAEARDRPVQDRHHRPAGAARRRGAKLRRRPVRFKALSAGIVDATVASSEYVPIAEKQGIRLLVAAREILPNYMRLCIFSAGKTLSARRDEAIRFVAAEMTALRYALSHRDE